MAAIGTGSVVLAGVFGTAVPVQAAAAPVCRAAPAGGVTRTALAARLSAGITAALRGRAGSHAVAVTDPHLGITCSVNAAAHFYSASVVKATILAALLRRDQVERRHLTAREKRLATAMITLSDNNAATALWNDVGRAWLLRFLRLARMNQTVLGPGGYWGLTQITAHDETLLLWRLLTPDRGLSPASRAYELYLMAHVVSYERWGVPAGAPAGFTVHLKNGWAPLPLGTDPWYVNSIGCFTNTGGTRDYTIVVLTHQSAAHPAMVYGVTTIQDVALAVNHAI